MKLWEVIAQYSDKFETISVFSESVGKGDIKRFCLSFVGSWEIHELEKDQNYDWLPYTDVLEIKEKDKELIVWIRSPGAKKSQRYREKITTAHLLEWMRSK